LAPITLARKMLTRCAKVIFRFIFANPHQPLYNDSYLVNIIPFLVKLQAVFE